MLYSLSQNYYSFVTYKKIVRKCFFFFLAHLIRLCQIKTLCLLANSGLYFAITFILSAA
jgi:hypothetical protein